MSTLWVSPFSQTGPSLSSLFLPPEDVISLVLAPLSECDRSLESVDKEMQKMRHCVDHNIRRSQRQFSSELTNMAQRPGSLLEHRSMLHPIHTDAEGNRQLKCHFDLRNFKPEEVNVTLDTKERCIKVEANHEVNDEKSRHCVKRHYLRHFYLPEDAEIDFSQLDLKSSLNSEGVLSIEAPLPKLKKIEAPPAYTEKPAEPTPITVKKI